eukprot:m.22500 g.22500  ORF g.22500 m.22500 type:complete len:230 (-) comp4010_c0_seq1:738-1427(-)
MGWQLLAVSGAAAALAALSALLWLPSNDFAPLDRRPWQDRDAPLWQAVHTKPFIITGSPADQWPAAGWTVARLAQLLPSRLDVRSSDSSASPVFRYASKAAPGEHRTMSWTQLVQAAEAAATGTTPAPALYFSTSLDDAAFAAVAAEIGSPTPFLTRSQAARHELHLWAGTAGASVCAALCGPCVEHKSAEISSMAVPVGCASLRHIAQHVRAAQWNQDFLSFAACCAL